MSLKGSGEALAQLIAEKANPKTDVWFGGTGDPHLQAAESDLTIEYKLADARAAAAVGAAAGEAVGLQDGRHLLRRRSASATTPSSSPRRSSPCRQLGRPAQARVQGRDPGGQPGVERHRLHDDRDAGAADGRGQGLRVPEGPAHEHRPVHALGHRADQGGGARRDRGVDQLRPRRRRARRSQGFPVEDGDAVRRHRRRDRLDEHRQGRAQPRAAPRSSTNGR